MRALILLFCLSFTATTNAGFQITAIDGPSNFHNPRSRTSFGITAVNETGNTLSVSAFVWPLFAGPTGSFSFDTTIPASPNVLGPGASFGPRANLDGEFLAGQAIEGSFSITPLETVSFAEPSVVPVSYDINIVIGTGNDALTISGSGSGEGSYRPQNLGPLFGDVMNSNFTLQPPPSSQAVPEPGSLLVWLSLLGVASIVIRKRANANS